MDGGVSALAKCRLYFLFEDMLVESLLMCIMAAMKNAERKVSLRTYLAYGAADLYGGGSFFIVTTFAMYYLVNVVGLHPVLAGLVPAIGKFWDAVSDPMMGHIADNTPKNRFGKRRVWFLVSILPICFSFMLIWFPIGIESQIGKFTFYTFAYLIFFTVETVSYVPYAALSAEITKSFSERNKLNSTRLMFSFISTLLAGLSAQPIIDLFNGTRMGYFVMACVFGLIFALPWIPLYFETWESEEDGYIKKPKGVFFKNFLSLFKNKSCRIHIAMYVCSFGALDIFMSLVLFYMVDYLDRENIFIIAQGTLLITMMLTLPVHNYFINKKGHRPVYITGLSIFAISLILMAFHTPQTPAVFLILNMVLMGIGVSANNLIPHQLLPFISDIDKLMSGENRAGAYSAAMTLTRKLFLGLVIMTCIGMILSGIGYKNPVPSVLTEKQFEEGLELCRSLGQPEEKLKNYYAQCEDGNRRLRYASCGTDGIILSAVSSSKKGKDDFTKNSYTFLKNLKTFDKIPADIFERIILTPLKNGNLQDRGKLFLLNAFYVKDGENYIKTEPENFCSKAELYNLKVFLDEIKYPYSGIGKAEKPLQKPHTVQGVKIAFVVLPLIMLIAGLIMGYKFRVSPENHEIILSEIKRLQSGGKEEDVTAKTKEVYELLTGLKYENRGSR